MLDNEWMNEWNENENKNIKLTEVYTSETSSNTRTKQCKESSKNAHFVAIPVYNSEYNVKFNSFDTLA